MNQGKAIKVINVMMVLMLLCTSHVSSASFKQCYEACIIGCVLGQKNLAKCAVTCLGKCIIHQSSTPLDYCKLDCAVDECVQFGKDSDKVDSCVNKCGSGECNTILDPAPTGAPSRNQ